MSMAPGRGLGCYASFGHLHCVYFSLNLRCPFIIYSMGNSLYCNQYYHISHDWHTLQTQNNIKLNRGENNPGGGGGCHRELFGGHFPVEGMS